MGKFLASAEKDLLGPWIGLLMGELGTESSEAGERVDWAHLTAKAIDLLPEVSQKLVDASDGSLLTVLMQVTRDSRCNQGSLSPLLIPTF